MNPCTYRIQPVRWPHSFFSQFFAMEHNYHVKHTYKQRSDGRGRTLNHITTADIQLANTLLTAVDHNGNIDYRERHVLYNRLCDIHETPIVRSSFHDAYEKFKAHGLLKESVNEGRNMNIVLPHFVHNGEMGRFIRMPSFVFTNDFRLLPVALQKTLLYLVSHQGDQRNVKQLGFGHLSKMMHRDESSHIQVLLHKLAALQIHQQSFFSHFAIERDVFGKHKLVYQVNPAILPPRIEGEHYREELPISHKIVHLKQRLLGFFNDEKAFFNDHIESLMHKMAYKCRHLSEHYLRIVVASIKQLLPSVPVERAAEKMMALLDILLANYKHAMRVNVLREEQLLPHVASMKQTLEETKHLSFKQFKQISKTVSEQIVQLMRQKTIRPASYIQGMARSYLDRLTPVVDKAHLLDWAYHHQISLQDWEHFLYELDRCFMFNRESFEQQLQVIQQKFSQTALQQRLQDAQVSVDALLQIRV